jgi:hypothetical protein
MKSPLWFVVAGLIAIGGFVAAGLYLWPRLGSVDAGMIRVVVPGNATLDLARPGTYTIFTRNRAWSMVGSMPPTRCLGCVSM